MRPARRPLRRPSCRAPRSRKRVPPTTSRSAPPSATGKPEERSPGSNPPARSFNCTAGRGKGAAGSAVAASCALAPLLRQRLKPLRARAPAKAKSGGCSCCSFWLFPVVARLAARRLSAPWFGRRLTAFFLLVLRWCCGTAAARALMRAPLLGLLRVACRLACAAAWAAARGVPARVWPADWARFGRAAGPLRSRAMLAAAAASGRCGLVAFPGGRGTAAAVAAARSLGVGVWLRG